MATPTTATEIAWAAKLYNEHIKRFNNDFNILFVSTLTAMTLKRIFLQRPHTDDMMEMCFVLGIDVPDFQPISFDGLTFKWRSR